MEANKNKILVITDNGFLYNQIKEILLDEFPDLLPILEFKRSKLSSQKKLYVAGIESLDGIDVKKDYVFIIQNYKFVISLHCKQIFPKELVDNILCVNIHPGYNPYNRGWYPQVFAIINKSKFGATIHVMDEEVDHGAIIDRKEVKIKCWDTSKEAYETILNAEIELFRKNIRNIASGSFSTFRPEIEGNYHSIEDYNHLCHLNLNKVTTLGGAIDTLRALSHGAYKNAYFFDEDGNKIFVKIELTKEDYNE